MVKWKVKLTPPPQWNAGRSSLPNHAEQCRSHGAWLWWLGLSEQSDMRTVHILGQERGRAGEVRAVFIPKEQVEIKPNSSSFVTNIYININTYVDICSSHN